MNGVSGGSWLVSIVNIRLYEDVQWGEQVGFDSKHTFVCVQWGEQVGFDSKHTFACACSVGGAGWL